MIHNFNTCCFASPILPHHFHDSNRNILPYTIPILPLLVFHRIDDDGNGVLTIDEFRVLCREMMGPSFNDLEADEAFDFIDADKSGGITLSEFKEGILKSNKNKSSGLPRKLSFIFISPPQTQKQISFFHSHTSNIMAFLLCYCIY